MTSLSSQERTVIQTLLELNYSVRAIARFIKRSPSTVSIEIHQVTPYKAEIAHALALKKRHLHGRHDTLTPAIAVFLNHHIGILKGSPETAAHVLGLPFKTIYNWLNAGRLKLSERTVIQTLLELNYSVRAIARFIKRSPSTVSIEIHQVTPYKAEIAHALA
ncbi:helix-turn-helix domain-containing protein, partial [Leuconostoc mesenteroides]|uniref:helix-turn-helix domain-containing protein n=1 Tax=Leuconostoc mesenteroides TaxID=1245 RepID=UPI001EE297E3